jgi:hypothetical protein
MYLEDENEGEDREVFVTGSGIKRRRRRKYYNRDEALESMFTSAWRCIANQVNLVHMR